MSKRLEIELEPVNEYVHRFVVVERGFPHGDEEVATGDVKFDGCVNWSDCGTMSHHCEPEDFDAFMTAVREAIRQCARILLEETPCPEALERWIR